MKQILDMRLLLLKQYNVGWLAEFQFAKPRRWRFDYALVTQQIAIEIEGGAHSNGRHTRGSGFICDMEKYNRAIVLGWRVLRYTPQQFDAGAWAADLTELKMKAGS